MMALTFQVGFGQVTVDDNIPVGGRWVGFDNSSGILLPIENRGFREIDISSNGQNKMAITELATWNGLGGLSRNDVQRTTLGLNGEQNLAWSMLHLWSGQSIHENRWLRLRSATLDQLRSATLDQLRSSTFV